MTLLVVQVGTDDILAGWTNSHTVSRLVIGAMAQALPHGRCLRLADAPAIINRIVRIRHLLDPIGKAAHELAVIVRKTGREVERAFRPDGADGTGRHTQLAFEAWVVVNRTVIVARFAAHQYRAQQYEVAEFRMDQVPVNAHMP